MNNLPVGIKLTGALALTLMVFMGVSFGAQTLMVSQNFERLSNLGAQAIFTSVADNMALSLEKGNMELFYRELDRAAEAKNVLVLTLYTGQGQLIQAAGAGQPAAAQLPAELLDRLVSASAPLLEQRADAVDLYRVDLVDADCVRCHPGWELGRPGAVLHMRYSKADLLQAQTSNTLANIGTLVVTVLGLVVIMFALIRRLVSRPLAKIAAVAGLISRRDLADLVGREAPDPAGAAASRDEIRQTEQAFAEVIAFIRETTGATRQLATGDLTVEVAPRSERDIFGTALARMIQQFRTIVGQLAANAANLRQASGELSDNARAAGESTDQINQAIQGIARDAQQETQFLARANQMVAHLSGYVGEIQAGADQQVGEVTRAKQVSTQITTAIEQLAANAQQVASGAAQATQAARRGNVTVQATIQEMRNIAAKTELTSQRIQEMGARSDQVGAIVGTIDEIASQTNLLALNAAIEAARAGEHGRGFAVVADEVRQLADQASRATREIKGLIEGILAAVHEARRAMEASLQEVARGVERAGQANQALDEITQAAQAVTEEAGLAFAATQRMTDYSGQLGQTIRAVSGVAEKNLQAVGKMTADYAEISRAMGRIADVAAQESATTEQVAASTQEMRQRIGGIAEAAQTLTAMALDLEQIISAFTLDTERAPAPLDEGELVPA